MKENPLLSVIVPVYNVQDYLAECLESIINQTYTNLEIICVNDGSTDGSLEIMNEYAKRDERIIIIDKQNGGQSIARNTGLDRMTGQYVTFVDSDDVIERHTYEYAINHFKRYTKLDFVQFPLLMDWNTKNENKQYDKETHYKGNVLKALIDDSLTGSVCNKIYKSRLWEDFRFVNMIYEDLYAMVGICEKADEILTINKGLYLYRYREGSTDRSETTIEKIYGFIDAHYRFMDAIQNTVYNEDHRSHKLLWIYTHVFRSLNQFPQKDQEKIIKRLEQYVFSNKDLKQFPFLTKNFVKVLLYRLFSIKFLQRMRNL